MGSQRVGYNWMTNTLKPLCYLTFCILCYTKPHRITWNFLNILNFLLFPPPTHCLTLWKAVRIHNIQKVFFCFAPEVHSGWVLSTLSPQSTLETCIIVAITLYWKYLFYVPILSKWIYSLKRKNLLIILSVFNSNFYLHSWYKICAELKLRVQTKVKLLPKTMKCNARKRMQLCYSDHLTFRVKL